MKKRLFFLIALMCCFVLAACVLSACNESDLSAFYGTYESLWGVGDITIDENGASTPETNAPVSVSDGKLTIEYDRIPWVMTPYENNDVLVLGEPSRFDENNIRTRSGYFSGHLVNFSGTGVSEQFSFSADGSYSYIDVSSGGYMQHSGSYKLQDGVLCMRGVTWGGRSVRCGYYITENYEFYMNVYVRNLDRFTSASNSTHPSDTTPLPTDPVIEYITSDAGRGEIQGDTHQQLGEGETGTPVTAIAHEGYIFTQWSDGRTDNPRTDGNLEESTTVYAEFRRIELTLAYTAGAGGSITGETSQTVLYGESGTAVTAVPEEGYVFVRWSDGVTTATRTDVNVTSDITVTAEFRLIGNTTDFAEGIGTADRPYEIETVEHLQNMELYPNAHFTLTADIVLPEAREGGSNFAPLFSDETMFGGTLDGQGHKIVNLTVYNTETFYSGLFSCISASGSVTNLVLENTSVSGTNYIGGIAGYTLGAVTDCTVSGSITYIGDNSYKVFVGGIAGRAEASVDGCVTDVTVTVDNARAETTVGGIVGYLAYGGSQSEPMTLAADGSVTVSASGYVCAGGLIGRSSVWLYLSDSYATGDVTSTSTDSDHSSYAGGLVGGGSSTVTDSYATGDVTSTGGSSSYAGGLVGEGGFNTVTVTDSYATGDVTSTCSNGYSYAGGLVGSGGSTVTDSYATGDMTSTGGSYSYAGGLVGYGFTVTVRNSYSVSCVSAESERGNVYIGGIAGYVVGSLTLENAHWYGGDGTAAEYAVGYSNSLGIPTSIGSTRHNSVEEFYTLADVLNAGREEPVWEHTGVNTLPTLIVRTDFYEAFLETES